MSLQGFYTTKGLALAAKLAAVAPLPAVTFVKVSLVPATTFAASASPLVV